MTSVSRQQRIAKRIVSGNKDVRVNALVNEASKVRSHLMALIKDLRRVGAKVKYLDDVGKSVGEALNDLEEADLSLKRVVDTGNIWMQGRMASLLEEVVQRNMEEMR